MVLQPLKKTFHKSCAISESHTWEGLELLSLWVASFLFQTALSSYLCHINKCDILNLMDFQEPT